MKKVILFTALIMGIITGFSQTKKGKSAESSKEEMELGIYRQAIKYGDANVAISNLYILIAKHPEMISYKDSLASIYFQSGQYNPCLKVCSELIQTRSNDSNLLRMSAMCHQGMGMPVEAIADYDQVIKITKNIYDIYQKASLEYRIKRLQESKLNVETVIKDAKETDKIVLYIDQENKQTVPIRAAAYNLYGMIAKEFNDTASARFFFNEAIKIYPEFYFANANIKVLDEMAAKKSELPAPVPDKTPAPADKRK